MLRPVSYNLMLVYEEMSYPEILSRERHLSATEHSLIEVIMAHFSIYSDICLGEEDSYSIQFALDALRKNVCTKSNERLLIEVEIFLPTDFADLVTCSDRKRLVAEIVLKLVKQLKAGPLKQFNNNRDCLTGAIAFLATDEGNRWSK